MAKLLLPLSLHRKVNTVLIRSDKIKLRCILIWLNFDRGYTFSDRLQR